MWTVSISTKNMKDMGLSFIITRAIDVLSYHTICGLPTKPDVDIWYINIPRLTKYLWHTYTVSCPPFSSFSQSFSRAVSKPGQPSNSQQNKHHQIKTRLFFCRRFLDRFILENNRSTREYVLSVQETEAEWKLTIFIMLMMTALAEISVTF